MSERDLAQAIRQNNLLAVIGADGTVLEANPRLLKRLGYTQKAVVGQSFSTLLDGSASPETEQKHHTLISEMVRGSLSSCMLQLRSKDQLMVLVHANIYAQGSGDTATAIIVASEVHESESAQHSPRSQAEANIHSRMLSIEYDLDGQITAANPNALSLLGYKISDLRGKTEEILATTPIFEGEKYQNKWRNLRAGKPEDMLCHFFSQDGDDVFIQAHYEPILDSNGEISSILLLGCDVSGSEKRLRKAFAMMERKSAALNDALQESREAQRMRDEMDRALQAMATPVTPIWDQVLLLPLVGIVDSTRTDDAMKTTLDKISATGAKMFILDISGVPSVDTAVANQLIKITKATKIMGCETIVSGVSSAIAHTIVELGIDIGEMLTTSSLRDAVSISLDRVDQTKKEKKNRKKMSKKAKQRH